MSFRRGSADFSRSKVGPRLSERGSGFLVLNDLVSVGQTKKSQSVGLMVGAFAGIFVIVRAAQKL